MKPINFTFPVIFLFISSCMHGQEKAEEYLSNWPEWRGPELSGYAPRGNPPVEWSESENIKWKVKIPGRGHATPIVWNDRVFILTAVETDESTSDIQTESGSSDGWQPPSNSTRNFHDFSVLAINRSDGSIFWERVVTRERPSDKTHEQGTWASNSPVTDGEFLYAYFGSRGLYCLDFEGNIVWSRDFGQMEKKMSFGEGSSPTLHKEKIIIQWDHEGDSYLYILDKKTGKDIFRIPRDEATSWASPMVVTVNGQEQVITSATGKVRGYDLNTGKLIWEGTGMTANVIPNPVVSDNLLILMSGFRGNACMAIDLTKAKGSINGTEAIIWEYNKNTPYTPSPLLANGKLYFLRSNNGNLTCLDVADGKVNYELERLDGTGTIFASPVGAGDRLYVTSESGITYVIKQGPDFEILAKNQLDDGNFASPAIVDDELFIRGFEYLYCLKKGE